ncbi:MAG TPA: M1 family aminopeptidase [Gemmatimonadaceae bacterium]|nr:M1 family aminopeptidase [Gemmatimonadaceae bacterium]
MLSFLVAALLLPQSDSLDRFMAPGVSRELAEWRAAQVRNVAYDLRLDVTARDTARGRVVVSFERVGSGDVILDFRGPRLGALSANGQPVAGVVANGAHVRVPSAALRPGANTLAMEFAARIAPSGASIIRFHDSSDGADYLYTLLVPADANQLFPCFDQPDLKARVTFALRTPAGWSALANGAEMGSMNAVLGGAEDTVAATVEHRFAETKPISTYLIAFAAGPWARLAAPAGTRPMTLYVRASRAKEVEADSLFARNAEALDWLERYFDRPFPFDKFDFLLAPAFPFGGMEHPGAVFYNEDRFVFRERPTMVQRIGRAATIYHEVAHQWFGDLVTMRWFDDLWLKEGFATYMAAKVQDAIAPGSEAWKSFYLRNKPLAYGVDATRGTTPVWQELANLDQAKSNYGPIVYNKAPSVLKQLNYLVGEDAFRGGVRTLLRERAYANATWHDLLDAVGRAAGRSLEPWGAQFILRRGMPVVEPRLELRAGAVASLTLAQRPAQPALSGPGPWPMRVEVLLGYGSDAPPVRIPVEITGETTAVRRAAGLRAPSVVFANAGDYGYALTLLDPRSVRWLEANIGTVGDAFLRAMLWGSLWDQVRDARLEPARYVALAVRELPRERDEQIAASTLGRLTRATGAYLSRAQRDSALPAVEAMLRAGAADSARPYGLRKLHFDALVQVASSPLALRYLDSLLDSAGAPGAPPPPLGEPLRAPSRWAIVTALLERGAPGADRRLEEETRRDTTSDGTRRAFIAGAARPSADVKRAYFERYLRDSTLNEDWATASLGAFNSPLQQTLTLPYLVPALDTLPWIQRNRRIFFLGSWLGAFLDGHSSAEALARVERFLATHPELPRDLREKILQNANELERTVRIRRAFAGAGRE